MRDLWRGNANAWECDELGHLNVRFYLQKAMEAFSALLDELGLDTPETGSTTSIVRTRELHVRYHAEARPGAALNIEGGIVALDAATLSAVLVIRHWPSGTIAATVRVDADHAHPGTGRAFPFPRRIHDRAAGFMVEPPTESLPRGVETGPPAADVSVDRADALGLIEIGRGMFRQDEANAYGLIRLEVFQGRVSDGAIRLFTPDIALLENVHMSVALLEARFIFRKQAAPGDRFVIRSGFAELSGKIAKAVHWILDPETGEPWCTLQGAATFFDLKARKSAAPPKPVSASLQDRLHAGLEA